MRLILFATVFLGTPLSVFGSSAAPNAAANGIVDRIFDAIQNGKLPPNDIAILEHAAEGNFLEQDVAVVLSLGIPRDSFSPLEYTGDGPRVHAYRRIGDLGTTDAIRYLSAVTKSDVGNDYSQQVWPAARIALYVARSKQILDPQTQIEFVRRGMDALNDGRPDGSVRTWAEEELCNRGDLLSLDAIHERRRARYSGPAADEQWHFCKARMDVVATSQDRVRALASALRIDSGNNDILLISWALSQLAALRSSAAYDVVARFGEESRKFTKEFPSLSENIRVTLAILERK